MPKNKTHSGAKKRFRVTGSGKVMREQAGHVHKFHEKTPQKARALSMDILVARRTTSRRSRSFSAADADPPPDFARQQGVLTWHA